MKVDSIRAAHLLFLCMPLTAGASTDLQADAVRISKEYVTGNSISLSCQKDSPQNCVLVVRMHELEKQLDIDFARFRFKPVLGELRLFSNYEDGHFSFSTDIECEDADYEHVPAGARGTIKCIAFFSVDNGQIEKFPSVQVLPIVDIDVYRPNRER